MTDHRTEIVKWVMRSLEETTDPEELVSAYFDVDHDMVVQATQQTWREAIAGAGIPVTTVQDRQYFRSIYFHEPGGVLFEIATDDPGFTVDEAEAHLGNTVKLPEWLEARRVELESRLPTLTMPQDHIG